MVNHLTTNLLNYCLASISKIQKPTIDSLGTPSHEVNVYHVVVRPLTLGCGDFEEKKSRIFMGIALMRSGTIRVTKVSLKIPADTCKVQHKLKIFYIAFLRYLHLANLC